MPARVRAPTRDFASGINASYSNWGTALAGHIVATVSGMEFDEYIERNIYQPLGMTSSSFREPLPPGLRERMSQGYRFKNGEFERHDFEFIHNFGPAGSMSTTATDMAKFMLAHLNDGALGEARILKPETAQLMHARTLSPNPALERRRARLLRDLDQRPARHRPRRRYRLLPYAAAARAGREPRRVRLVQHRQCGLRVGGYRAGDRQAHVRPRTCPS